jgi:hypothetical protein
MIAGNAWSGDDSLGKSVTTRCWRVHGQAAEGSSRLLLITFVASFDGVGRRECHGRLTRS